MPHVEPLPAFIAANERYGIPGQRFEIMFRDGQAIGLHQVYQNGAPVRMLRALRQGNLLFIFDLSQVHRELAADLPATPTRDIHGLVFFHLRAKFKTAQDFVNEVSKHQRAILTVHRIETTAREAA